MLKPTEDLLKSTKMYETRFNVPFPWDSIPVSETNEGLTKKVISCLRSNNADISGMYDNSSSNQGWDDVIVDSKCANTPYGGSPFSNFTFGGSSLGGQPFGDQPLGAVLGGTTNNRKYSTKRNYSLIGAILAAILSWGINKSILWAFVSAILSWFYVIYYVFRYCF